MRFWFFFKGNIFRVKIGANSPALGGTGTWGLGVALRDKLFWCRGLGQGDLGWDLVGDNFYGTGGKPFWVWGLGQGDLGFWGGTWLGTTFMGVRLLMRVVKVRLLMRVR